VEGKLPEKITITIKCPMTPYQATMYNWVQATGTLRIDPKSETALRQGCAVLNLKNTVMEQRKVCLTCAVIFVVIIIIFV
jgi:SWI/SNF-related matrix-associated actin-dependent regulator of chromatin subfamily A protein 2/4